MIIITYNQELDKIILTLESILQQTFDDYEIIISDDGSANNFFPEIEAFFQKKKFDRYQLIPHKENQGTVRNLISALEYAKGIYVKDFGPGDLFYDRYSLERLYEYFIAENCDICMGLYKAYYKNDEGAVCYKKYLYPMDLNAYIKGNAARILKNLVLYGDRIPGVCLAYKREIFSEYMYKIKDCVIYLEDIFEVLSTIDGRITKVCGDYLYLYEVNVGISTSNNKQFDQLLNRDIDNFYAMFEKQMPEQKLFRKRKRLSFLYKIDNLYLRTLVRLFFNPGSLEHIFWYAVQIFKTKECTKQSLLDNKNEYPDIDFK